MIFRAYETRRINKFVYKSNVDVQKYQKITMKIEFLIFVIAILAIGELKSIEKKDLLFKNWPNNLSSIVRRLGFTADSKSSKSVNQTTKINAKKLNSRLSSSKNTSIENQCWTHPCLNGATCYGSSYNYLCQCPNGFVGLKCEINSRERKICGDGSCYGNGICIQNEQYIFRCECFNNYTGLYCDRHKLKKFEKFSE